jgi:hypothetical protein
MTKEEVNKLIKDRKINILEPEAVEPNKPADLPNDDFIVILEALRRTKHTVSVVPTFTPRNFYDQIQFYKLDADYRVYLFVGGDWKYITLT